MSKDSDNNCPTTDKSEIVGSSESSSDSEEESFYDAIEGSATLISKYLSKHRSSRGDLTLVPGDSLVEIVNRAQAESEKSVENEEEVNGAVPCSSTSDDATHKDNEVPASSRLSKFEETVKRLNSAGDEEVEDSPGAQSSSQTSSVDGLYPQRQSRPFKVVEQDSVSLSARIRPPDIISSCVTTTQTEKPPSPNSFVEEPPPLSTPPVAPPRRRRRNKSPTISIASNIFLDKDVVNGNSGVGVVTAQDEERTRCKTSGPRVLRRTESLGLVGSLEKEAIKALAKEQGHGAASDNVDSPGSSQLFSVSAGTSEKRPPFVRTKTDSGKLLSDLEILEQVTV